MEIIDAMAARTHLIKTIGFAIFVSLIIVKIAMQAIKSTQLDDFICNFLCLKYEI